MEEENRRILEFCKVQQDREEERMHKMKEQEDAMAAVQKKVRWCEEIKDWREVNTLTLIQCSYAPFHIFNISR